MKASRLILGFFTLNTLAVVLAINLVQPKSYADFQLQDVTIQQIDTDNTEVISGRPTQLRLESVGVDIAVASGGYDPDNKKWDLSDDKAHYATITPEANNTMGNTFIYGHNKPAVFAPLDGLTVGDQAQVTTDSGTVFIYTLKEVRDVEPTDVSLFEYQGPSQLTVQTCTGSWFEKRRLFIFDFTEVR